VAPPAERATAEPFVGANRVGLDEDLVRRVTSEMLRRLGYDVVCAASGEEALDLLDDNFDALVTDVAMTGMNGRVLADRVHERTPGLPVLFVSGYPAEVLTGEHMVAEGSEVLTKPFTSAELADRIELIRSLAPLR
jgi:CheY-like chemotaxis protein